MKIFLRILLILLILTIGYVLYNNNLIKEGFISGTQIQLLSSKPYYTWYDFWRNPWRNSLRYPLSYRYPYYSYPRYYYGYPFYRPRKI